MTEKRKWPNADALAVAKWFKCTLTPVCEIVAIAGSLRRMKPMVGDIEIAFVPKIANVPDGLFDTKPVNMAEVVIEQMLAQGIISKRLAVTGRLSSWGEQNKHAVHVPSGIPVDFFCEKDIQDWPRTLAIRTGPKEFNIRLMETAPKHGWIAHAYNEALHDAETGTRVIVQTEREFIERCGVPYVEPQFRQ